MNGPEVVEPAIWPIIGVDESGKGDFFGPLVIAGTLLEKDHLPSLSRLEVRDSKAIANRKLLVLAAKIKKICVYDIVVIGPEKYNQLYDRIKNLNRLLGWGHARVIENILARKTAPAAVSDKFGHEKFVRDSLQKEGKKIRLIQIVRAEAHPAVAAASILARAEFLSRMDRMSEECGLELPRGASSPVDAAGRELVKKAGKEILDRVAKRHFKNYKRILSVSSPA